MYIKELEQKIGLSRQGILNIMKKGESVDKYLKKNHTICEK